MAPKKRSRKNTDLQESTAPPSEATSLVVEASPPLLPLTDDTDVALANIKKSADEQITSSDPPPVSEPPQIPLNQTNFENIFHHPQTHFSAVALLNDHLLSASKSSSSHRVRYGDGKMLRSSDPKPEKQGQPKTDDAVPGQSAKVASKPGTSNKGVAMVQELLNRYETNKKKAKYGSQEVKENRDVDPLDDDNFVFDEKELDLWDAEANESELKSDFLRYTVPQYDIKEKLYAMHCLKIKRMTPSEVEKSCLELVPKLREILNGTQPNERHDIFKRCGISKQALREITVGIPYNSAQELSVMNVINEVLFAKKAPEDFTAELLNYISHVLVPEALVRIYATANRISIDLAEKELRFHAGYDGHVDEDLITTLTD